MTKHELIGGLLFAFACAAFAATFPTQRYVLVSVVAGVTIKGQPTTLERCERQRKEQPHLRAQCVPVVH